MLLEPFRVVSTSVRATVHAVTRDRLEVSKAKLKVTLTDVMRSKSDQRAASCGAGRKQNEETRRMKALHGRS